MKQNENIYKLMEIKELLDDYLESIKPSDEKEEQDKSDEKPEAAVVVEAEKISDEKPEEPIADEDDLSDHDAIIMIRKAR